MQQLRSVLAVARTGDLKQRICGGADDERRESDLQLCSRPLRGNQFLRIHHPLRQDFFNHIASRVREAILAALESVRQP